MCVYEQDAVVQAKSELGITFLQLKWEDLTHFCIPEEDLVQAVRFIHHGRLEGSVLVHCAQVSNIWGSMWNLYSSFVKL